MDLKVKLIVIVFDHFFATKQGKGVQLCHYANHIHLIWQIQPGHKIGDVQRDFLKYTAQNIKFDLLKITKHGCNSLRLLLKHMRYQV